jgi:hypothetical protein
MSLLISDGARAGAGPGFELEGRFAGEMAVIQSN